MRVHNSVVSSIRTALVSRRAEQVQRRELASLLSDPELSPSTRQEMVAIIVRDQDVRASVVIPAQRRVHADAGMSRSA